MEKERGRWSRVGESDEEGRNEMREESWSSQSVGEGGTGILFT